MSSAKCPECGRTINNLLFEHGVDYYCPDDGCRLKVSFDKRDTKEQPKSTGDNVDNRSGATTGGSCMTAIGVFAIAAMLLFLIFNFVTCSKGESKSLNKYDYDLIYGKSGDGQFGKPGSPNYYDYN